MPKEPEVELLGANTQAVRLVGRAVAVPLRIDRPTGQKVLQSFTAAGGPRREPDRIFLNLENITGTNDAAIFDVYVGLGPDEDPETHPANFAGVVSLFGLRGATTLANPHGGNGLNKVIEITDVIDRLQLRGSLGLNDLSVRFVAANSFGTGGIQIGRVSVYRQAG